MRRKRYQDPEDEWIDESMYDIMLSLEPGMAEQRKKRAEERKVEDELEIEQMIEEYELQKSTGVRSPLYYFPTDKEWEEIQRDKSTGTQK